MSLGGNYDDLREVLSYLRGSDLVVGIPSKNVAHTIAYVLHNVVLGINKYLKGLNPVIIVCDGLSEDSTVDVVKAYRKTVDIPIKVIPNRISKGKGGAVKYLIDLTSKFSNAKSLVLLDSDLRSITPEWIALLYKGTLNYGLALPNYLRHKYDATITNFIVRPLIVLTYGVNIKQPIGGDFGLSRDFVDLLSESKLWSLNPWALYFGIDAFITITALAEGFRICEVRLGAKVHEGKDPGKELKSMFIEVLSSLLVMLREYLSTWLSIDFDYVKEPEVIEEPRVPRMSPWEVKVDPEVSLRIFREGVETFMDIYDTLLTKDVTSQLRESKGIDSELWSKILVKILISSTKAGNVSELAKVLFPLWQGRLYRYYVEVAELSSEEALELINEDVVSMIRFRDYVLRSLRGD